MAEPRWTISVLTIPGRERFLSQLVESLAAAGTFRRARLSVVFNRDTGEAAATIEGRLRRCCGRVPVDVAFNMTDATIAGGRQAQLNACRTERMVFVDDDVTVHGDLLGALEQAHGDSPLGIVGIPSFVGDTSEPFKPRESTPSVTIGSLRFMPVQGMLVAGYRRLFLDIGGFNPRRRFWGEWTELNLRMWRSGFPTAYVLDGPHLRHWHDAPESPTRNRPGRERDIVWGLMCTALEYDAVEETPETASFWRLVDSRYLAYAFDEALTPARLLSTSLSLAPRLAAEWADIAAFRDVTRAHPFAFAPFARLTLEDVERVMAHAASRVEGYRTADAPLPLDRRRWPRSLTGLWRARRSA